MKSGSGPQHRYHIRKAKGADPIQPAHHPLQSGSLATLPMLAIHYGTTVREAILRANREGLEASQQDAVIRTGKNLTRKVCKVRVWRIP